MRHAIFIMVCVVVHMVIAAAADVHGVKHVFPAMHAVVEITIPVANGSDFSPEQLATQAEAIIHRAETLLSPKGVGSDVCRLNDISSGEWLEVDPMTMRIVREALRWHTLTGGLFDPTIGPLKKLFRFSGKSVHSWPSEVAVALAREHVGAEKLLVDIDACRIAWKADGMSLDLGGIAKGFAADLVADAMLVAGVTNALVNVGGEMRALGGRPGSADEPWRVSIVDPRDAAAQFFVEIKDRALATSGDYESYFEYDGKRFSHIIDPRTGSPMPERVAGATVSHPRSATVADVLATVMCIMGSEKAAQFFMEHAGDADLAGVEAVIFEVSAEKRMSVTHISVNDDGSVTIEKR